MIADAKLALSYSTNIPVLPSKINSGIDPTGFSVEGIVDNSDKILQLWFSSLFTHTAQIFEVHLCRARGFLPPPISAGPIHPTWLWSDIYKPNDFELFRQPIAFPLLQSFKDWESLWVKYSKIVAWPGLLGLLGSISLFIYYKSRKETFNLQIAFWLSLIWGTLISLSLFTYAPDYRYAAIAQILGFMSVVILIVELISRLLTKIKEFGAQYLN